MNPYTTCKDIASAKMDVLFAWVMRVTFSASYGAVNMAHMPSVTCLIRMNISNRRNQ